MKKLLLSAAVIIAALSANAQISYGGQLGASFSSAKWTDATSTPSKVTNLKTKVGFTIGAIAEIELSSGLSFRPELNFTQKGGKISESQTSAGYTFTNTGKMATSYLEIAPNFTYNFEAGTGKVFVGAGPNLAFGMCGKTDYAQTVTPTLPGGNASGSNKIKFDGKKYADLAATDVDDHFKSLDLGINLLGGYKLSNGAFVSAGYTIGLSNISPNDKETYKNSGFTIKIGYLLGGNKKD